MIAGILASMMMWRVRAAEDHLADAALRVGALQQQVGAGRHRLLEEQFALRLLAAEGGAHADAGDRGLRECARIPRRLGRAPACAGRRPRRRRPASLASGTASTAPPSAPSRCCRSSATAIVSPRCGPAPSAPSSPAGRFRTARLRASPRRSRRVSPAARRGSGRRPGRSSRRPRSAARPPRATTALGPL